MYTTPMANNNKHSPCESGQFNDLYPERRNGNVDFSYWQVFTGKANTRQFRQLCEQKVIKLLKTAPMVKTMIGQLHIFYA